MQVADFLAAAGVDPYAMAEDVLTARPPEVAALGEAFVSAAAVLQTSGGLSALAGALADASAVFNGESPTQLMAEVGAVQQTLVASPEVLHAIGVPLCALAGETAMAQQMVSAALIEMQEKVVPILQSYAQSADVIVVGAGAWWNQHIAAGAAVVQAAYAAVSAVVDAHEARLAEVLLALQAAGYVMPADVDAGVAAPAAAGSQWAAGSSIGPYYGGTTPPADTAAWWAGLTAAEQASMIQAYPQLLGLLHGLPAHVYHTVNLRDVAKDSASITVEVDELAQSVWDIVEHAGPVKESMGITGAADIVALPYPQLLQLGAALPATNLAVMKILALRGQQYTIGELQKSIVTGDDGKDRYLLEYGLDDFAGDGKAVIGIGEVDTADNVAVVVQGATHDLDSIVAQTADAEAVLTEMDALSDQDNAVIVYEGYDNPDLLGALFDQNARWGGAYLSDDLDGYAAAHKQASDGFTAHTTVISHSYGTLATSYAMRYGAADVVDDFVLYGSPGLGVEHVSDLGKNPENVYVGIDSSDILVQLDGFTEAVLWNHLGPDPAAPTFGATVLGTGGVDGHGDYFGYEDGEPNEALKSAAAIAVNKPHEAVVTHEAPPLAKMQWPVFPK